MVAGVEARAACVCMGSRNFCFDLLLLDLLELCSGEHLHSVSPLVPLPIDLTLFKELLKTEPH